MATVTRSKSHFGRSATETNFQPPGAEELVRRLVHRADNNTYLRQAQDVEEIMLDIDIDGWRYLLVRMPRRNRPQVVLSPREHEIARMIARGHHNKTVAGVLNISLWTVCTHLRRIFAKLGVNSRAAMVARLADIDIVREAPVVELTPTRGKETMTAGATRTSVQSIRTLPATTQRRRSLAQNEEMVKSKTSVR